MNQETDEYSAGSRDSKTEAHEQGVEVPYHLLQADTLDQLVKSFVLREGTDYGDVEASLKKKVSDIRKQLESGDLKIVFDLESDSGSIVRSRS